MSERTVDDMIDFYQIREQHGLKPNQVYTVLQYCEPVAINETTKQALWRRGDIEAVITQLPATQRPSSRRLQQRIRMVTPEPVVDVLSKMFDPHATYAPLVPEYLPAARPRSVISKIARPGKAWVYYLQATSGGPVKIGKTTNARARLMTLQTMAPHELTLLAVEPSFGEAADVNGDRIIGDTEAIRHAQYDYLRLHGEWFDPLAPLIDHIQQSCLVVNLPARVVVERINAWLVARNDA